MVWQDNWTDLSCLVEEERESTIDMQAPSQSGTYRLYGEAIDPAGSTTIASLVFHVGELGSAGVASLPLDVLTQFSNSGWMGDTTSSMVIGDCASDLVACTDSCQRFTFTIGSEGWGGMYWQYPANNWGSMEGLPVEPGATTVRFTAWTDYPGQDVTFVIGLDGVDPLHTTELITLTGEPTEYTLVLPAGTYDDVITPFGWVATAPFGQEIDFSVAGARWE